MRHDEMTRGERIRPRSEKREPCRNILALSIHAQSGLLSGIASLYGTQIVVGMLHVAGLAIFITCNSGIDLLLLAIFE